MRWSQLNLDDWPVYQAYSALDELPHNAPLFDITNPILESKERFCRVRGAATRHCGEKFGKKQELMEHMQRVHGAIAKIRPGGALTLGAKYEGQKFYLSLMKDVEYPDKRDFEEALAELKADEEQARARKQTRPPNKSARRLKKITPKMYHRFSQAMTPGTADDGTQHESRFGSGAEDDTADSARFHAVRRRHGILSPDLDDGDGDTGTAEGLQYNSGEENLLQDITEQPTTNHSSTPQISKRQRLTSPKPKLEAAQHDFILIEDDPVEADAEPVVTKRTHDTKENITLIEDDSDDEDKKPVVLLADDDEEGIEIKQLPATAGLLIDIAADDDMEDMEFEVKKAQIKRAQLAAELEEVELKQKMAAMRKRKAGN